MAEHATVIDVSRYSPAPGKREELLAAMRELASMASQAPGCFGAQACSSDRDATVLVAISRWESQEALDSFADSSGFETRAEQLTPLLAGPVDREHYRPV